VLLGSMSAKTVLLISLIIAIILQCGVNCKKSRIKNLTKPQDAQKFIKEHAKAVIRVHMQKETFSQAFEPFYKQMVEQIQAQVSFAQYEIQNVRADGPVVHAWGVIAVPALVYIVNGQVKGKLDSKDLQQDPKEMVAWLEKLMRPPRKDEL